MRIHIQFIARTPQFNGSARSVTRRALVCCVRQRPNETHSGWVGLTTPLWCSGRISYALNLHLGALIGACMLLSSVARALGPGQHTRTRARLNFCVCVLAMVQANRVYLKWRQICSSVFCVLFKIRMWHCKNILCGEEVDVRKMASKAATLRQAYSELAKADAVGDNEKALRTCNRSELRKVLKKCYQTHLRAVLKTNQFETKAFQCKIVCMIRLEQFEEVLTTLKKTQPSVVGDCVFEKAYAEYRLNRNDDALATLTANEIDADPRRKELLAQLYYRWVEANSNLKAVSFHFKTDILKIVNFLYTLLFVVNLASPTLTKSTRSWWNSTRTPWTVNVTQTCSPSNRNWLMSIWRRSPTLVRTTNSTRTNSTTIVRAPWLHKRNTTRPLSCWRRRKVSCGLEFS